MYKCIIIVLLVIGLFNAAMSQKIVDIRGEYTLDVPKSYTLLDAEKEAVYRAELDAMIGEFGQIVYSNNTTIVENSNGKSRVDVYLKGGSLVKGIKLFDNKPPKIEYIVIDGSTLKIRANVDIRAREIVSANYDIEAKTLINVPKTCNREGDMLKYERNSFKSGDDICLYFKSPKNGYLAVYLYDIEENLVYFIDLNNSGETVKIKSDKDYVFLKPQNDLERPFRLTFSGEIRRGEFYFVFSPKEFSSAKKKQRYDEFDRWLGNCLTMDNQMVSKQIVVNEEK